MLKIDENNSSQYPIDVSIDTSYLPERSDPEQDFYVFNYTVTLRNGSELPARLLGRHWIVTNDNGDIVRAIEGRGAVGELPELEPGMEYQYSSRAILRTPLGAMQGGYQGITSHGEQFFTPIEAFRLAVPSTVN